MDQQKKSYYNCSVDGCLNSTLNGELTFFKLPSASERRNEWLRLIHREDLIDSNCCRARVCEAHFNPNFIAKNSTRKLLKRNAIPHLLLPLSNNLAIKGIPVIIETADAQVQTSPHLSDDTLRTRVLSEIHRLRTKLNTLSETNTFLKLCDKFLTPKIARVVKKDTKIQIQREEIRKLRSNKAQINYLCNYMLQNKEFASGEHNKTPLATSQIEHQWQNLKMALDELGPHRSIEQWKIAWRDQKRKARAEGSASKANNTTTNTGTVPELGDNIVIQAPSEFRTRSVVKSEPEMAHGGGCNESPIGLPLAPSSSGADTADYPVVVALPAIDIKTLPGASGQTSRPSSTAAPNRPAPLRLGRATKWRIRGNTPPNSFLVAQAEMNGLLKELIKEVRRSNELREEQNFLIRRSLWLKKIKRTDLLNQPTNDVYICEKHFAKSDITWDRPNKTLKDTADPDHLLPDLNGLLNDKAVQSQPLTFDYSSQTDYSNMESKAVQITPRNSALLNIQEMRKKITACKAHLMSIQKGSQKSQKHAFRSWCDQFLSPPLAELIKTQTNLKFNNSGNKYDHATKAFSLNTYQCSKHTYDFVSKHLSLPCDKTIQKFKRVPIGTEYNEDIMEVFHKRVDNMTDREKYCSVLVDMMPLRTYLKYIPREDRIVGLHDVDGKQLREPARYVLVIFVRGLLDNWIQPITFAFLSEARKDSRVSEWVDKYLEKLLNIGLKVKTYVQLFRKSALDDAHHRSVTIDKPYFFINNNKILYVFNVPDLLKKLRDTFLNCNFNFKIENRLRAAGIAPIMVFLKDDLKKNLRLAPKLTLNHLNLNGPASKYVRYAAQLLSRSVAIGLEIFGNTSELTRDTIYFVLLINNLFDVLNSSNNKGTGYKRAYFGDKNQIDVLHQALQLFQTLQVNSTVSQETQQECSIQFAKGFQITIKAIMLLNEDLKQEGYDHFFTRNLSLDACELFFKRMRESFPAEKHPTSKQFYEEFSWLFMKYLLSPSKNKINLRDLTISLIKTINCDGESTVNSENMFTRPHVAAISTPEHGSSFVDTYPVSRENNIADVCKRLLKACVARHKDCTGLKTFVKAFNSAYGVSDNTDLAMQTETISPVYFVSFIEKLDQEFCKAFEEIDTNSNLSTATYEKVQDLELSPPCPCFPTEYLIRLFIRMRIYMIVNYNKNLYKKRNYLGVDVIFPILTAI